MLHDGRESDPKPLRAQVPRASLGLVLALLGRAGYACRRALRWLSDRLSALLETAGLAAPPNRIEHAAQLAKFRTHHCAFRNLLGANDSFVRTMADLECKLLGQDPFDVSYLRRSCVRMVADVHRMVESLDEISSNRYPALRSAFHATTASLAGIVDTHQEQEGQDLTVELSAAARGSCARVGSKVASLAEVRNSIGLPTPDGFAVSGHAYRRFTLESGLDRVIGNLHMGLQGAGDVERISALLRQRFKKAEVMPELVVEILAAYDRLCERTGRRERLAVRSSAVGEDGTRSFAGQYATILNVGRQDLVEAWKNVAASLYCREAIHYRLLHGLPGDEAVMAVGFVTMVEAVASGIVLSLDPARPQSGCALVQTVSGLGTGLADGATIPESIWVDLDKESPCVHRIASRQSLEEVCDPTLGIVARPAQSSGPGRWLLADEEAVLIARWARVLEAHFGCPQDVEWAMDANRRVVVLQSRPLRVTHRQAGVAEAVALAGVLLRGGEVACPGFASGPALHMDEDGDFDAFPHGAILIAKRSSPKFVGLMGKAVAIVTDAGSTTGHMASLAREFRVPTLVGLHDATVRIPDGMVVTVDGTGGYVYEGEVAEPGRIAAPQQGSDFRAARSRRTPAWHMLERAAELVVPLTLGDARSSDFCAANCTTLHDIVRFADEMSYGEMFRAGDSPEGTRSGAYRLDVVLPIDLYIIDLGGAVAGPVHGDRVTLAQIERSPLGALMRGMLYENIPRFGARSIEVAWPFSIMMRRAATSSDKERKLHDQCYALVSDRYVNYTARGHLFGVVDAYCSETANKNYVNILFRGGAADLIRRSRRARAIAGIVNALGFAAQVEQDSVRARIGKTEREETERLLGLVGRLFRFMRRMDVAMISEDAVHHVKDAFLCEDYALDGLHREAAPR